MATPATFQVVALVAVTGASVAQVVARVEVTEVSPPAARNSTPKVTLVTETDQVPPTVYDPALDSIR